MPIVAGLVFVIQMSFVIHALKTGRPTYWIFIIMGFPVLGCVIYYFIEVFPGSREHRDAHKAARRLVKSLQPDADLKRRAEELEVCGSVDNKLALARECSAHQMHEEAIRLYESCLQGAFAADGAILFELARACVEAGRWDKAAAAVARLKAEAPSVRPAEVRLLEARLRVGQGDTDGAITIYRELVPAYVGMEARYRYGDLLARLGQHEAANHVFNEILKDAKRQNSFVDEEQQWIAAARKAIVDH
ncbi:MAG TPA: tetratricopeptide repeat protein [Paucimonas sp.]|nr:tetratricopeptide repeat protein [Paucimonas sp.]